MLRVVGAGLGRTGTSSLKDAFEQLLGAPCYHMREVFEHLDHVPTWHAAICGEQVDWSRVLDGYAAIVDWPGAACWRSLAAANPNAVVLLSTRSDPETWWRSATATIFGDVSDEEKAARPELTEFGAMIGDMFASFEPRWQDRGAAIAAYERHNASVREEVPVEPFPHTNSTEEFTARRESQLDEIRQSSSD